MAKDDGDDDVVTSSGWRKREDWRKAHSEELARVDPQEQVCQQDKACKLEMEPAK